MLPDKVPQLTIPLFPYLRPGDKKPSLLKRIRPGDALDIRNSMHELEASTIVTLDCEEKPWSVVAVVSPYSPDVHVMTIETSVDRYVPGPEWIPDAEGNALMQIWISILEFISEREQNTTVHVGYNWSPRAWGKEEEKTGFQSIPTKWHAMLWGWPAFPEKGETTEYAEWIEASSLGAEFRRLMGENDYAEPLGWLVQQKLEKVFPEGSEFVEFFPPWEWRIDGRGLYTPLNISIVEILRIPDFFSQILKPVALILDQIFKDLTGAITTLDCRVVDEILLKTERGMLNEEDTVRLRAAPSLHPIDEIKNSFVEHEYPETILKAILDPVRNRCREKGNPMDWWRKGFGYAFVLSGPSQASSAELRIMPGVFVGPGGVVEAQGVVLRRPEDRSISLTEGKNKSQVLWQLADRLKAKYSENAR